MARLHRALALVLGVAFVCFLGFVTPAAAQSSDGTPVAEPSAETPIPEEPAEAPTEPSTEVPTETPTDIPAETTEEVPPEPAPRDDLPSATAAEPAESPAATASPEPSSGEDADDPQPTEADDDVQVAAVSVEPVDEPFFGLPFTTCDPFLQGDRWSAGNLVRWTRGGYVNTGDEPLIFEFTATDALGTGTTVTEGPFEPGAGYSAELLTTVTALDVRNWEIDRTITFTARGTVSGDELTVTHQLACPFLPFVNPILLVGCPDDFLTPYQAGDVFRFRVEYNNAGGVALGTFSLTTEDGTLEPPPPATVGSDDMLAFELLHVVTADEAEQRSVVGRVTETYTFGPPPGSAAEGVYGPFTNTDDNAAFCTWPAGSDPTATPTQTPTATPTATATATPAEPTEPAEPTATPTATTPPDPEPTPRPTHRPTESPVQEEAPGTSKLPNAGTGGAVSGDGQPIGLVVLVLTALVLLGISRLRRPRTR